MKKFILALLLPMQIFGANGILVVSNTNDSGAGSFRQAITDANSDPLVPHIIQFSIGTGVQTIQPLTALPAITAPYTMIDGTTQSGWSAGNPVIVLDGSQLTAFTINGLTFSGTHHCLVRGLVINGGFDNGILIIDDGTNVSSNNSVTGCFIGTNQTGTSVSANNNGIAITGSTNLNNIFNKIGGDTTEERNIISGNENSGILLQTNTNFTIIRNNYIGTDINGTSAIPNLDGVTVVGSLTPVAEEQSFGNVIFLNLISGNTQTGVRLNANTNQNLLQANSIGVDSTGILALPNEIGILTQGVVPPDPENPTNGAVNNTIIGSLNVIAGNSSHGIALTDNTLGSSVGCSFIGTDLNNTVTTLGNGGHGILIQGTTDAPCINNTLGNPFGDGANVIAYNGTDTTGYGIVIMGDATTPDVLNTILANSIFNNVSDGVALFNNSNNLQSAPTIINAILNNDGNALTVGVTAPSTPADSMFRIEFFVNDTDRSPITEGQLSIGFIEPIPSGATVAQLFPLSSPIVSNIWVSAIATNFNGSPFLGDSSPHTSNVQMVTLANNIPAIMFQ